MRTIFRALKKDTEDVQVNSFYCTMTSDRTTHVVQCFIRSKFCSSTVRVPEVLQKYSNQYIAKEVLEFVTRFLLDSRHRIDEFKPTQNWGQLFDAASPIASAWEFIQ
jgi:hypothetical protein